MVRWGTARQLGRGTIWPARVRSVAARQDSAGWGKAVWVRWCEVRLGAAWRGEAVAAWYGLVR